MTWFFDKEFLLGLDLSAYDPAVIAAATGVALDQASAFVDPGRLYMVQSAPDYGWLAGANADHRPCLLFVGEPRLESEAEHPLSFVSFDTEWGLVTHAADIDLESSSWDDVLAAAEAEVGFTHVGDCPVRAFVHPQMWHCAVVPFPWHLHSAALGLEEDDEEDQAGSARAWIEAGGYVLHCGNAYYMSADGEVESS